MSGAGNEVLDPLAIDPDEASNGMDSTRRKGRPRKTEAPRFPVDEVDRLLVSGEPAVHEQTGLPATRYPSVREIATRFKVSHSVIAQYAARHNCTQRRTEIEAKARAKADAKLVTLRAARIAVSTDDAVAILDEFVLNFADALKQGRVRCDNPTDLNTALRLKTFLLGGADHRQEVLGGVSLEHIQEVHRNYRNERSADTGAARGELPSSSDARKESTTESTAREVDPEDTDGESAG